MGVRRHARRTGRLVSWLATVGLVAGSIAIATPALAKSDTGGTLSARGQGHKHWSADKGAKRGHDRSAPAQGGRAQAGQGGSGVSLPRPNDFQAQSDPDGLENGGVDQPGGQGGLDPASQDGNNGSGNDADCEDDNNGLGIPGHCKDRPETVTSPTVVEVPLDAVPLEADPEMETFVLAGPFTPTASSTAIEAAGPQAVASGGSRGIPGTSATVLPDTGAGQVLLGLALAGLATLAVGAGLVRQGRRARAAS